MLTILVYLLTILGHSLLPKRLFKGQESYFWLLQLSCLASDNIRAATQKDIYLDLNPKACGLEAHTLT